MSNLKPTELLESLHGKAAQKLTQSAVNEPTTSEKLEFVCRCNANKAPIRFLMACLLAKACHPNLDIRKPYTEIPGGDSYSGRLYDEKYVEPFVHKHKLPCNPTTAFLTPAFRNLDRTLTTDLVLVGRPRRVYEYVLEILDLVHGGKEQPEIALKEILRFLIVVKQENELRMAQLIADLKNGDDVLPLASEEIVTLLVQHLNCKGASRLPVLMVAAAYQTVKNFIGEENKSLLAHNAADKQTGSIGDVEITLVNEDKVATCYEMKDKKVTKTDIDVALQKISTTKGKIDNYIFITTEAIENEAVEYAKNIYDVVGVEFVILDCIGFIRHFLHFFHRLRTQYIDKYQAMVLAEPTSAVSQPLKEVFLTLRRAAETDGR